ncbi:unnamed protein product [Nippostrongylus brasiliensis]|uniref:UBC core domain-containing protein n=1 Tax=Nippostrongylus brasiliensis TaxID=27835 RepID=A0A0N4Y8Y6_NIPBR|nr:unnamed protein product [Nippostrongylus brasiliensis]
MKLNRLVHIKNVTSTIERIKLKVEWETEGLEYLPERAYIIKFNTIKGRPMEDVNATQESMARICEAPMPRPKCYAIGKGVPQWGNIGLEVPRYNKRYYIQVACLTSAGRGPWSKGDNYHNYDHNYNDDNNDNDHYDYNHIHQVRAAVAKGTDRCRLMECLFFVVLRFHENFNLKEELLEKKRS